MRHFGIILLIVVFTTISPAQWTHSGPYGGRGEAILCMDSLVFLGTDNGLYRSTDHGGHWAKPGFNLLAFDDIKALSSEDSTVVAAGFYRIYASTDKGVTWNDISGNIGSFLAGSSPHGGAIFIQNGILYAGGFNGRLLRSTNFGTTWTAIDSLLPRTGVNGICKSGNILLVGLAGGNGIYRSFNEGVTWSRADSVHVPLSAGALKHFTVSGATGGIIAATSEGPYYSTDDGVSWSPLGTGASGLGTVCLKEQPYAYPPYYYYGVSGKIYTCGLVTWPWQKDSLRVSSTQIINGLAVNNSEVYAACYPLGVLRSTDAGATFDICNTGIEGAFVQKVGILDSTLFAASYLDRIYTSTDWGTTWAPTTLISGLSSSPNYGQFLGVNYQVSTPIPKSAKYMLQAPWDKGLWKSTDFGLSWIEADAGISSHRVNKLASFTTPSGVCLVACTYSGVAISTNDGTSWTAVKPDPVDSIITSVIAANDALLAGSSNGTVYRSVNNGATWRSMSSGRTASTIQDMARVDSTIFLSDYNGVFRTTLHDTIWAQLSSAPTWYECLSLAAASGGVLAMGDYGAWYLPTGSTTWTQLFADGSFVAECGAVKDDFVMIGTYNNSVLTARYSGLVTDVRQSLRAGVAVEYALHQNYPNPFNPSTIIAYTIAGDLEKGRGGERVRLSVYDLLGREVAVLVDGYQTPGEHRVTFDARSLASGIYFYRLVAGGQSLSRKLVLLK